MNEWRELTPDERDALWDAIQGDRTLRIMTRDERLDAALSGVFTSNGKTWRIELPTGRIYSGVMP